MLVLAVCLVENSDDVYADASPHRSALPLRSAHDDVIHFRVTSGIPSHVEMRSISYIAQNIYIHITKK